MKIPFYRPFLTGNELRRIEEALSSHLWGGDGPFSKKCSDRLRELTGSPVFLTSSGTHALELAFMALGLERDDEVILPSYTFVSCANAVVQMGLKPVFVDVREDTLNIDESLIERALTPRTKAVLVVHYAGVSAAMDPILDLARRRGLFVVEDAAQGVNAFYKGKHLGTLGDLGVFSFHNTKNVTSGEGGAIVVNNEKFLKRVEVHRQKGTDRSRFLRGEVDKYSWIDRGSCYWLSDILAALLFPQLEVLEEITQKRKAICDDYAKKLAPLAPGRFRLPVVPPECRTNHHIFYLLLDRPETRDRLRAHLRENGVEATAHFVPLHASPGGKKFGEIRSTMTVSERAGNCLLRLPLYAQMTREEQGCVIDALRSFFEKRPVAEEPSPVVEA